MAVKHRFKTKDGLRTQNLTAMTAIRHKCKDCSNWYDPEVKECPITTCALYPFRMGRNPERWIPKPAQD